MIHSVYCVLHYNGGIILPSVMMLAFAEEGLLLATVHVYSPGSLPDTVRVCVYCAVTGSFNTVSVPSVILVEFLVHWTVVAGPPVEIQVRINCGVGPFKSEISENAISDTTVIYPA